MPYIELPDAKPYYELIAGELVQKMSPKMRHGLVQARISAMLERWAGARFVVATEWDFRLTPPGEPTSLLVPDVAMILRERLLAVPVDERQQPPIGPDVAVEVLSPSERVGRIEQKRRIYRACGTSLYLLVDPLERTIEADGAFEDLRLDPAEVFAVLDGLDA